MLTWVFLAMFLPCAGTSFVFLVYVCLLWYITAGGGGGGGGEAPAAAKAETRKGLSKEELEKLPKVTGKELVLGTDCAVCLDDIDDDQQATLVPGCNHGFHIHCAHAWLSKKSVCPVCRHELDPELFAAPELNPC